MTVGELAYQQAIEKGYPAGVASQLGKVAETYQRVFENMREPLKRMTEVASSMSKVIGPQVEAISRIRIPTMPELPSGLFIPSRLYGENDELIIPAMVRPVQEVRIVNSEDITMAPTKRERELTIASYPLPQNATWESLSMKFIDGHFVHVSYPTMESKKFDFKDMGFVNERTMKPDRKWELLRTIAEHGGALTKRHWNSRLHRNIKYELNEGLKRFFGMKENPIPHYTKRDGYKTLFSLKPER